MGENGPQSHCHNVRFPAIIRQNQQSTATQGGPVGAGPSKPTAPGGPARPKAQPRASGARVCLVPRKDAAATGRGETVSPTTARSIRRVAAGATTPWLLALPFRPVGGNTTKCNERALEGD